MSDLHVHFHGEVAAGATLVIQVPATGALAAQLTQLKELLTMNQQEALDAINAANAQLQKIGAESAATLQKVADLETVIASMQQAGQEVPQVLADAIGALVAQVKVVDDLVPDAPVA